MLFLDYVFATGFAVFLAHLLLLIKKLCRGQLRPGNAVLKLILFTALLVFCIAAL